MAVNAGIMDSVSSHWPENVQIEWIALLSQIKRDCYQRVEEIQLFAEALDQ